MKYERFIIWLMLVAGMCFVGFVFYHVFISERPPSKDPWAKEGFVQNLAAQPYHGIDISQEQGYVDWRLVAMDPFINFAYVKATEGVGHLDPRYPTNVISATNCGIFVGSYHRMTSDGTVTRQFFNFSKHVDENRQRLLPMVDLDEESVSGWSKEGLQDSLALFSWLVGEYYGVLPLIRTDKQFYETHLHPRFSSYPLCITDEDDRQPQVDGAENFLLWRSNDEGTVPGIYHAVGMDSFTAGTSLSDIMLSR